MTNRMRLIGAVALAAACAAALVTHAAPQKADYKWRKTDSSLALLGLAPGPRPRGGAGDKIIWKHVHNKKEGKPYFHPLTLAGGPELTWLRPADHVWHRAVWFSWKMINGLNYWEENRNTGLSQGRTEITKVAATANKDSSAKIEMTLSYHPPDKAAVLTEKRVITVGAPDKNGQYHIDWRSTFTAGAKDAVLDRTPIPGEKGGRGYGGYAGLSLRMAKSTRKWTFLSSEGLTGQKAHGKKARWVDFSGDTCGVAVFDHPSNVRHPQPWYVAPGMPYFGPAPLFNKPYTLAAGKSLSLRHRILIHPARGDKEKLEKQWQAFSKLKDEDK